MKKKLLILTFVSLLVVTGCIRINTGNSDGPAVKGVFKSFDGGENWFEQNRFLHSGGLGSIHDVDILDLVFDPQDLQAIYATTRNAGLLYSYDEGQSWMKSRGLEGQVESVAIDPHDKCTIYVGQSNTIRKSTDCTRTWQEIYIDTRGDKIVTNIAIDHYDNFLIYSGNVAGEILKSFDGGVNWQVIHRLNNRIMKILIDPTDSRVIYVATERQGVFKTVDGGQTWEDINDGLKQYSGSFEYKDLSLYPKTPNALMLVSKHGLIRTLDGGQTWEALNLLTPPTSADIYSMAINPQNESEIFYATASTFYKTVDGGQNWITKRLVLVPGQAFPIKMLISPVNPAVIYMGVNGPLQR